VHRACLRLVFVNNTATTRTAKATSLRLVIYWLRAPGNPGSVVNNATTTTSGRTNLQHIEASGVPCHDHLPRADGGDVSPARLQA